MEVLRPLDVAYTYRIRPAKNFGATQSFSLRNIKLVAAEPADACSQVLENGAAIRNQVLLVVRGECSFVTKALNAEMYGAVAVVISDNEIDSSVWIDMIGDGTNRELLIEIPVYFLRGRDGSKIRQSILQKRLSGALVNVPVNYTQNAVILKQPPWDPW